MEGAPDYRMEKKLRESDGCNIYSAIRISDNGRVIVKTPLDDHREEVSASRLFNEFETCGKFDHKNIVKYIELIKGGERPALISEYFEAVPLDEYIPGNGLDIEAFLTIAIQIAAGLAEIHGHNIIHQAINPENILIDINNLYVKITGFGRSIHNSFQVMGSIETFRNSAAYISPEQTGRVNRCIDYRTDFYSLGVTFHKMLTGALPFDSDDILELAHSHIAKKPVPPHRIKRSIPSVLSEIVLKLLSKNADERYHSAEGLKHDLDYCRLHPSVMKIGAGGTGEFKIGRNDFSDKFRIPRELYGREKEKAILLRQFNGVCGGGAAILYVTGYSGVGKSAIVDELRKEITIRNAYFAAGKFEHLKRDIAYSAITHVFKELIRQILSESDDRIKKWRKNLRTALNVNGQVIVDIIPELELIIGKQSPARALGSAETRNRLNMVFRNFISVFDRMAHPLVIFLDDLQWIDLASLDLIKLIAAARFTRSFFFIGAYRSNEVDASHPVMTMMEEIKKTGVDIQVIDLHPLDPGSVNRWVADALHRRPDETKALSGLILQKTGGNPFFIKTFLQDLHDEKLIRYAGGGRWRWSLEEIVKTRPADNVADLMIDKINKLPGDIREILTLGACMGIEFSSRDLSIIVARPRASIERALDRIAGSGMIVRRGEMHRFIHDKVLEAAYSSISGEQKPSRHLQIGRLLLSNTPERELDSAIFEIVGHLNKGRSMIADARDRIEPARLNLVAGKKAKASAAYGVALNYFAIGVELLGDSGWDADFKTALALHAGLAECEYINGNIDDAERYFKMALARSKTPIQKAKIHNVMVLLYYSKADMAGSLESGVAGLDALGVRFPVGKTEKEAEVEKEFKNVQSALDEIGVDNLALLPETTDPETLAILDLCMNMLPASYVRGDFDLYTLLVLKMVSVSLHSGNSPVSAHAYACHGVSLVINYEDYSAADRFGRIGLRLCEKYGNPAIDVKVKHVYALVVNHWKNHCKTGYDHFLDVYHKAVQTGDIIYIDYAISNMYAIPFFSGRDLDFVVANYMKFHRKVKSELTKKGTRIFLQFILALKGKTRDKFSLSDDEYDEESEIRYFLETGDFTVLLCYYVYKCILYCLFGNYGKAGEIAIEADRIIDALAGCYLTAVFNFYQSLVFAGMYRSAAEERKKSLMDAIVSNQRQMRTWANNCPENFLHKYCLVEAELARMREEHGKAMDLYDKAVELAGKNEFPQEEALANELAAKFWLQTGRDKFARLYMTGAYRKYRRWGAASKIAELEEQWPYLRGFDGPAFSRRAGKYADDLLDGTSVIKAMQAISNEIVSERLFAELTRIIIENAGARKGYIVLDSERGLSIVAGFDVDGGKSDTLCNEKLENTELLSEAIVRYVVRTGENIILGAASSEGGFIDDGYIRTHASKSVLAMPVLHKNKVRGALYLENDLAENIFSDERIKLLELILSQAAISLENAKLFDERLRAEEELRRLRNYLTNIIDSMPSVLVGVDAGGDVTLWNRMAERTTDVPAEGALGKKLPDVFPGMAPEMKKITESIRTREIKQERKRPRILESGSRCEDVTIYPLVVDGVEGAVIRVDDVTNRVRMEEMMIQNEKMLSVGGLAAGMAHEINNPLAGMIQTANVMSSRLIENTNIPANLRAAEAAGVTMEAIRSFLEARGVPGMISNIKKSGRRLVAIVDNMLGFARKSDSRASSHSLEDLLDKALALASTDYNLKKRFDFKRIEIRKEYGENTPPAPCEGVKIQQVLLNILGNGAYAMREAEVETPVFTVRTQFEKERKMVRLDIEDNGPGMDEATLKRIFDPFFTTKPEGVGTGLGLSVSYFIITENHGGELEVDSRPGSGAKFIIRLPVEGKGGFDHKPGQQACASPNRPVAGMS